jgi:hypothetical protein
MILLNLEVRAARIESKNDVEYLRIVARDTYFIESERAQEFYIELPTRMSQLLPVGRQIQLVVNEDNEA